MTSIQPPNDPDATAGISLPSALTEVPEPDPQHEHAEAHRAERFGLGRVDRRVCQGIGCTYDEVWIY